MTRTRVAIAVLASLALERCARKGEWLSGVPDEAEFGGPPEVRTADSVEGPSVSSAGPQLDESRCNWLLEETGVDIPGWRTRSLMTLATIACVAGLLLAVATQAAGRPLLMTLGLSVSSGLGMGGLVLIADKRLVITDTARSGFWPSTARHLNRWLQLAGPRFFVSILTFTLSVVFISWGAKPDIADLERSVYAGVASALWVISGTALITIFYEYRRQLRMLRRSAEPTIVALRNDVPVPPEQVSRLLMSLSYGVAAAHTGTIGIIDAARARTAIAIYSATRSPSSVAPIIEEASQKLGLARPMDAQTRERFIQRTTEPSHPAERLRANEILGHTTATAETRDVAFKWINGRPSVPLPVERLLSSLPPADP